MCHGPCMILVPWARMEPRVPTVRALIPKPWTSRGPEVPLPRQTEASIGFMSSLYTGFVSDFVMVNAGQINNNTWTPPQNVVTIMRFKPFFQIQNTPLDPQISFLLLPCSLARAAVCPRAPFAQQLMLLTLPFMRNVRPNTREQRCKWRAALTILSQAPSVETSLVAQTGKNPPTTQETQLDPWVVRSPGEGNGLPWMGLQRAGHDCVPNSILPWTGHDCVTDSILPWGDRTLSPWLLEVPPLTEPAQTWVWNWTGPRRVGFEASTAISGKGRLPSGRVVNGRGYARVAAEDFCHHKGVICLRKVANRIAKPETEILIRHLYANKN